MPNTRSAAKRARQSERRRQRNVAVKSATRTAVRRTREALEQGDTDAAATRLRDASAALDRAVKKGVLHRNEAARRKSRLARRLNALTAPPAGENGSSPA